MEFTKEYFIQKFEAIPEEEVGTGALDNHCALWHCGITNYGILNEEGAALVSLFGGFVNRDLIGKDMEYEDCFIADYAKVYAVNDGFSSNANLTPKQRILEKLKSL